MTPISQSNALIEFVFVACLTGEPAVCRTESRLLADMTLLQCMTSGQFIAADWGARHPDWRVQRHRCRMFDPRVKDL